MKSVIKWVIDVSFRPERQKYSLESSLCVITCGEKIYESLPVTFTNPKGFVLYGSFGRRRDANCLKIA